MCQPQSWLIFDVGRKMNAMWVGIVVVLVSCLVGAVLALRRGTPTFKREHDASPPLDPANPLVRDLCDDLRTLEALPISSNEERAKWYAEASRFRTKLRGEYAPIYDSLPHELEHYLSDADIRAKEPAYAENQKRQLAALFVS